MVLLLSHWVDMQPVRPPDEQLSELGRHVRLQHVSNFYLHCVLPRLDWFVGDSLSDERLACMAVCRSMQVRSMSGDNESTHPAPRTYNMIPPSLTIEFAVEGSNLEHLYNGHDVYSDTLYVNGTYLRILLSTEECTDGLVTLGMYIEYANEYLEDTIGLTEKRIKGACLTSCTMEVKEGSSTTWLSVKCHSIHSIKYGCGTRNILSMRGGSIKEMVSGFLDGDKLVVRATDVTSS